MRNGWNRVSNIHGDGRLRGQCQKQRFFVIVKRRDDVFGVGKPVGAVGLRTGKIKVSGRLSGKRRLRVPVCAHVLAGQLFYLGLQNCRAIHGKEKVYGSIP